MPRRGEQDKNRYDSSLFDFALNLVAMSSLNFDFLTMSPTNSACKKMTLNLN
jgi:hypothetical protein